MNIAVLVSGGVDSSVALRLLKDQGHTVTAFYLKIWLEDELAALGDCPWEEDLSYVRAVCDQAGVPLKVISLQKEYWQRVVSYVIEEVKAGRTPNPDVLCNKHIKFGAFFDHLGEEFDFVATGHYAQITHAGDVALLNRAPDTIKDQTYFLAYMTQNQLKKALFPIGHLTKNEVRTLAQAYNLPNKDRKDSQGICFLGKIKFSDFIKHHLGHKPGDMIEFETGKKLGTHPGFYYFTLGQRQGSGLAGGPWYVVKKDPTQNQVYVSRTYYSDDKKRNTFTVGNCNWLADWKEARNLQVKLRHGPKLYQAQLSPSDNGTCTVQLAEHDQGIAPGQFAVFYDDTRCLGAGVILE
jgi:tRNA (5-methylaminomethyl-2-thiouridylate)-methyltransferase